jgi:putrescine importer
MPEAATKTNNAAPTHPATPHLRRVLSLWDLIFYGVVAIEPIAAVPLYGVGQQLSRGHMIDTILVGMVPILFTALSYGRMAALYPAAGSAYSYVGRGLNPHAGFLAGWAMFLCYLAIPTINVVLVAATVQREFPHVPFWAGALGFAALITGLKVLGVRWTARSSEALLAFMCIVILLFIALAIKYLVQAHGAAALISSRPFYNPETFNLRVMVVAMAFAALTFTGFDGLTTLAEEAKNPRRNVLLALVVVVLFTGVFSCFQVYLAQLVMPDYNSFVRPETAFMDVCQRVGGLMLFHSMGLVLVVAAVGSSLTGQASAARILFGMARENVLPRRIFAYLDPKRSIPSRSIWATGVLAFAAGCMANQNGNGFELAGEVINCGAYMAFMGVNLAAFWQYWVVKVPGCEPDVLRDIVSPAFGFFTCFAIWLSLPRLALLVGGGFLLLGLAIAAVKTRGFRASPVTIEFGDL